LSATNVPTVLSKLRKWGDYASFGEPALPSKFIPMKTPLSPTLLREDTFENVLLLPNFLAEQRESRGRDVGLVIDLSNHDCLYGDGIPEGLERVHVRNVAKSVPDIACTSEVIAVASEFWSRRPNAFVAIHCAYGFNRTGFVLCCYLIEACGLSADDALASFATARPPGVKHDRFKVALRRRYPTPGCAPVPRDAEEEDDGGDGDADRDGGDDGEVGSGGDGGGARGGEGESWRNETLDLDNVAELEEALVELEEERRASLDRGS
jgi:hypothetical protein